MCSKVLILANFVADRDSIQSICRGAGINSIATEQGFFPHYQSLHAGPLGFSWESTLPRMMFREINDT